MSSTPLYDALRAFAGAEPLRMHMPGHKGKPLPLPELAGFAALDVTELPPTGDLYAGGGPIEAAEALWARVFHFFHCFFLTGGSTQAYILPWALPGRPGEQVLLDRGCHRSAFHALALLDLYPVFLERPWLSGPGVAGPIAPEELERQLSLHPGIKTVCITSPTYYGVLSDIPTLARIGPRPRRGPGCGRGPRGPSPFLGDYALSAADLAVVSAHKTLPAPGQTALLFSSAAFDPARVRRTAALFGTSSPSFPFLAALDATRAWMEEEGGAAYRRAGGAHRFPCGPTTPP